jgi:hypothetical protein
MWRWFQKKTRKSVSISALRFQWQFLGWLVLFEAKRSIDIYMLEHCILWCLVDFLIFGYPLREIYPAGIIHIWDSVPNHYRHPTFLCTRILIWTKVLLGDSKFCQACGGSGRVTKYSLRFWNVIQIDDLPTCGTEFDSDRTSETRREMTTHSRWSVTQLFVKAEDTFLWWNSRMILTRSQLLKQSLECLEHILH